MIRGRVLKFQRKVSRESLSLYCFEFKKAVPRINSTVSVDVELCNSPVELENVQSSVVEERILQGHKLFVARHQSKPIAYLFVTTTKCRVGEIDDTLRVDPNEVYLYDAYTNAEYRGNRIYPSLITNVVRFYKGNGFSCALIFTTFSNQKSVRGIKRAGFSCYQIIHYYNLFGFRIWNYTARSHDVQSRFSYEGSKAQYQFRDMERTL